MVANKRERSIQTWDIWLVEQIVCTMTGCEGTEEKEGANCCIIYSNGSTLGRIGCKKDEHGFGKVGVIFQ